MKEQQDLINAVLRSDFKSFLHRCVRTLNPGATFLSNWHIDAIAYQLDRVRKGEITRLIINLPPRYLKSLTVSVAFPAFLLGHDPRQKIFGISYGTELSAKHAGDFRSIVQSAWYRRVFPNTQVARAVDSDVYTTRRGFRKSTSVSAALTGFGGDIFIIDDPQKPVDAQSEVSRNAVNQWFSNTLRSRLDNKVKGVIIIVMQRVHLNDLTGYLTENPGEWTVLSLPAIAESDGQIPIGPDEFYVRRAGEALHPEYETLSTLEKLRNEIGTDVFSAQYQQTPVPPGGAMIHREWLRYYDTAPERSYRTKIIQSWDTAAKDGAQNDWSVCTTWMKVDKHFYLLDLTRGRYEYPRLREMAIALADRFKPHKILIEDASTGTALAQELRQAGAYSVKAVPIERDKVGRLYVQQAKFEAGLVLLPKGAKFLGELEAELLMFPQAKHDDIVDSITQALAYKPGYDSTMVWATG
ncbi:Transposase [Afipia felis]|uniref:Transposase n=1 Tax=Afipia felis TaxID=1035 RepID=A0A090MKX7_AFIFE|nr:phage terminase large subunit [Afipia felis]CEG06952.1 Transposase [Afipia felis]